jgi:hypothetical protein
VDAAVLQSSTLFLVFDSISLIINKYIHKEALVCDTPVLSQFQSMECDDWRLYIKDGLRVSNLDFTARLDKYTWVFLEIDREIFNETLHISSQLTFRVSKYKIQFCSGNQIANLSHSWIGQWFEQVLLITAVESWI